MLFQKQTTIAYSESTKHACKSHTLSEENYIYLLLNVT